MRYSSRDNASSVLDGHVDKSTVISLSSSRSATSAWLLWPDRVLSFLFGGSSIRERRTDTAGWPVVVASRGRPSGRARLAPGEDERKIERQPRMWDINMTRDPAWRTQVSGYFVPSALKHTLLYS